MASLKNVEESVSPRPKGFIVFGVHTQTGSASLRSGDSDIYTMRTTFPFKISAKALSLSLQRVKRLDLASGHEPEDHHVAIHVRFHCWLLLPQHLQVRRDVFPWLPTMIDHSTQSVYCVQGNRGRGEKGKVITHKPLALSTR